MTFAAQMLAHQGGWDEMLMVAGPIFLLWLILRSANRRAQRAVPQGSTEAQPTSAAQQGESVNEAD